MYEKVSAYSSFIRVKDLDTFLDEAVIGGVEVNTYRGGLQLESCDVYTGQMTAWPTDPAGDDPDWYFKLVAQHLLEGTVAIFYHCEVDGTQAAATAVAINTSGQMSRLALSDIVASSAALGIVPEPESQAR
jgi:hypothetical protein